jgi:adenosine deaminase
LPLYRKFHVPVALSTDDEGVSRIDLTHEYVRAVMEYNLGYSDLKQMVRTGLEHDFLPGRSLWRSPDDFRTPQPECAQQPLGVENLPLHASGFWVATKRPVSSGNSNDDSASLKLLVSFVTID